MSASPNDAPATASKRDPSVIYGCRHAEQGRRAPRCLCARVTYASDSRPPPGQRPPSPPLTPRQPPRQRQPPPQKPPRSSGRRPSPPALTPPPAQSTSMVTRASEKAARSSPRYPSTRRTHASGVVAEGGPSPLFTLALRAPLLDSLPCRPRVRRLKKFGAHRGKGCQRRPRRTLHSTEGRKGCRPPAPQLRGTAQRRGGRGVSLRNAASLSLPTSVPAREATLGRQKSVESGVKA